MENIFTLNIPFSVSKVICLKPNHFGSHASQTSQFSSVTFKSSKLIRLRTRNSWKFWNRWSRKARRIRLSFFLWVSRLRGRMGRKMKTSVKKLGECIKNWSFYSNQRPKLNVERSGIWNPSTNFKKFPFIASAPICSTFQIGQGFWFNGLLAKKQSGIWKFV